MLWSRVLEEGEEEERRNSTREKRGLGEAWRGTEMIVDH